MPAAIVTGSGGLIGSESVEHFVEAGYDVVGLENDMRARFFGPEASTAQTTERLLRSIREFRWEDRHPRRRGGRAGVSRARRLDRAGDPHRGAAIPRLGGVGPSDGLRCQRERDAESAGGTRAHAPGATFIFCSTNKVYGDLPNQLPLLELAAARAPRGPPLPPGDRYVDVDRRSTHSLFGVSKAAADLLVQEYGRYFGMPTVCFRGGCLTGPNHAGAKLHGFLSYLMRCTMTGEPYTVFGYDGKQVRDNIHSADLVAAFAAFHRAPRPAAVYNIGGGRESNCSMLEAIELCQEIAGRELHWALAEDHGSATTAGGSPTWSRSSATTRGGRSATTWRPSCGRSASRTRSAGGAR